MVTIRQIWQQRGQWLPKSNYPSSASLLIADFPTFVPPPSFKPTSQNKVYRETPTINLSFCNGRSQKQAFMTSNLMRNRCGTNSRRWTHSWIPGKPLLGWKFCICFPQITGKTPGCASGTYSERNGKKFLQIKEKTQSEKCGR